jgi:hypothetical protein
LGVSRQNDIWVLTLWPSTKNRGKVVASPKFRLWWVLWIRVCLWFVMHQKCFNYALTKLLFGLCKSVWVIELLVILSNPHLGVPTCPSTLKVLWARECASTSYPFVVFTLNSHLTLSRSLGMRQTWSSPTNVYS